MRSEGSARTTWRSGSARISQEHQLPDIFFAKDRGSFDKGQLVRREDVCWGATFEDVRRANGDTYHTTNCSPQVLGYNRSARGIDNWGDLENLVLSQAKAERYCLFAGPVRRRRSSVPRSRHHRTDRNADSARLLEDRRRDEERPASGLRVRVSRAGPGRRPLRSKASGVFCRSTIRRTLEFLPTPEFRRAMVSPVLSLEQALGDLIRFPGAIRDADQFQQPDGIEMARLLT